MNLEESLGFKLAKASQRMFELFAACLDQAGITSKQNGAMSIIHEHQNITQKEVSILQRVDQTTMGQMDFMQAAKAAIILLENDYDVLELTGGIAAWKSIAFPTESVE